MNRIIAIVVSLAFLLSACQAGQPELISAPESSQEVSMPEDSSESVQAEPESPAMPMVAFEDAEVIADLYLQSLRPVEGGETTAFKRQILDDGTFSVTLPTKFVLLSDADKKKYYGDKSPQYVYRGRDWDAFFAFSYLKSTPAENYTTSDFLDALEKRLDTTKKDSMVSEPAVLEIDGNLFGYFAYEYPDGDKTRILLYYLTEANGCLLQGSFTCSDKEYGSWLDIVKSVMASIRDREQTVNPEIYRESDIWEQAPTPEIYLDDILWEPNSLRTKHVNFSLPPEQREVEYRSYDLAGKGISFNEILWLLRGEEDYLGKPIMGRIYQDQDKDVYHINITDESFRGSEGYFNDVINTIFNRDELQYHSVIIEYNGVPDTSLPHYGRDCRFSFVDYGKKSIHYYTPDEIARLQQEIPYKPPAFDRIEPLYSDEDMKELSPQKRTELESLWLGKDETGKRLITYLSSVMTAMMDYETFAFQSPDQAPPEFIMRAAWRCTNNASWSGDAEHKPQALAIIEEPDPLLGAHVEQTARLIFGADIPFTHMAFGDKTWAYYHNGNYYNHFPGGTGDGYVGGGIYPHFIDYRDLGDRYEVTVIMVNHIAFYDGVRLSGSNIEITPDNAYEMLTQYAPRAQVTLLKRPDGSLQFQSYTLLYTPSQAPILS